MAASVRVEDEAFADRRYNRLARLAGLADADHARGKLLVLWRQCTIENQEHLPVEDVLDVLGENGVDALVGSNLGERMRGDRVRIKGTAGRIEWLQKLRENGKKGGRPRKNQKVSAHENQKVSKSKALGSETNNPPAPAPAPTPESKLPGRTTSAVTEAMLVEVYKLYPVKKGKAAGLAKAKKLIKTRSAFDAFKACVEAMARDFASDTTYCPHFSTFVNGRLWEDEQHPSPNQQKATQAGLSAQQIWALAEGSTND